MSNIIGNIIFDKLVDKLVLIEYIGSNIYATYMQHICNINITSEWQSHARLKNNGELDMSLISGKNRNSSNPEEIFSLSPVAKWVLAGMVSSMAFTVSAQEVPAETEAKEESGHL